MTNDRFEARALREQAQYDEGLQRQTYDHLLNPAKVWFMQQRRERAQEIFQQYADGSVLELGSATWYPWVERNEILIDDLTCINISQVELEAGRALAQGSVNKPKFLMMDAQKLDFEDNSFDVVFGSAILHHLEFERALSEVQRVLKPGGTMFFAEPMDMNPVGRLVRMLTPKARTADERPFRMYEFRKLGDYFDCDYTFEGMVSVPAGVITALLRLPSKNPLTRGAFYMDRMIGKVPWLRYMCRHVFLEGQTPVAGRS